MPRKNLLRIHTARLAFPACARTDYEVMRAAHNRLDQRRNKARNVAAIAIEKNDQIAFRGNCRHARRTSATVSARRRNYSRSCVSGAFRRLVCAAIINNNDFARSSRCDHLAHDLRDWFFFIQRWNDNGNPHVENLMRFRRRIVRDESPATNQGGCPAARRPRARARCKTHCPEMDEKLVP